MKRAKKILSIVLTLCMVMQILPVFAEESTSEYGYIINDTFDDGTVCGWVGGAGNTVTLTPTTLETGESVLQVDMPMVTLGTTWTENGKQSTVTKGIENAVEFTGSNLIRIKARVKNAESDDNYLIKVNRPDATSTSVARADGIFNVYMVTGLNEGKPQYGKGVSTSANITNGYKDMAALPYMADGTAFDYTDVDLTDKWIDYTVVINGATNEQHVTASFELDGETVTLTDNGTGSFKQTDSAYDIAGRLEEKTFEAFERLTFASKDDKSSSKIYIDSVSVENILAEDIKAQILCGKTLEKDDAVKLQFISEVAIDSIPEGTIATLLSAVVP